MPGGRVVRAVMWSMARVEESLPAQAKVMSDAFLLVNLCMCIFLKVNVYANLWIYDSALDFSIVPF